MFDKFAPIEQWLAPGIVIGFLGVIIGAVVAFLIAKWQRTYQENKELAVDRHKEQHRRQTATKTEQAYLYWVIRQHQRLPITGLKVRSPVELELEQVYVSLGVDPRSFSKTAVPDAEAPYPAKEELHRMVRAGREESERLSVADAISLLDGNKRYGLVILGGPGTGKTTVLKYLALTYARDLAESRLNQTGQRLPIFVPLRTIDDEARALPLAEYLSGRCRTDGCPVEAGFFEKKLQNGEGLLLFDGLDEVANETHRQQVARWVEQQCKAFGHNNPIIVTSRPAGFREDYLPPGMVRLDIEDFSDEDIDLFARNWCLAVETMLADDTGEGRRLGQQAGEDLVGAIQANDRVRALAVNPLLLSIIALVHRYRARLPDRRVDLYADCVEVLLGHWDAAKDIAVQIPPGKSLTVLEPLALWMHEQKTEEDDKMVTREEAASVIGPHLERIGMAAEDADGFLDSIKDRSGLLVSRGLNLFGFQHQTFQEYLAARALADNKAIDLLISHFGAAYWREVTLLYAGMSDISTLLSSILDLSDERVTENWQLIEQMVKEAISIDKEVRDAVYAKPLKILEKTTDPIIAARASIWMGEKTYAVDTLIQIFQQATRPLTKGHFALLLGEVEGESRKTATAVLYPYLTNENEDVYIRSCAALALDMLGYDDRRALDNVLMANIPDGDFYMGDADDAQPKHLPAYLISRFPVTNGQYRRFMEAGGYEVHDHWSEDGWKWKEDSGETQPRYWDDAPYNRLSAPVVGISFYEAEAYAKWANGRLPTEEEWERAARGDTDKRVYPWGDEFDKNKANMSETDLGQSAPVCSFPDGVSPHGCYDMAGNVWEWTDSLYDEDKDWRTIRGGAYYSDADYSGCSSRVGYLPLVNWFDNLGFRLSRTP